MIILLGEYLANSIGLVAKACYYLIIRKIVNLRLVVVYFHLSRPFFHGISVNIVITYNQIILIIDSLTPSTCYLVALRMGYILT